MEEFCLEVLLGRGLSSLLTASYIYNNFFHLLPRKYFIAS